MKYLYGFLITIILNALVINAGASPIDSRKELPEISDYSNFFKIQYKIAINADPLSQLYVAILYEHGLGIGKDLILSHAYYNLATASGSTKAIKYRKNIERQLNKIEFSEARKIAKQFKLGVGIDHPRQVQSLERISSKTQNNSLSGESNINQYNQFLLSIKNNDVDSVENLVSAGANVNHRFKNGMTPLMIASINGNLNTVTVLLELGANANLKSKDNKTALQYAYEGKHKYIATILRTKTVIPNQLVKDIQTYLSKLGFNPGSIDGIYGTKTKRALRSFSVAYEQKFEIEISQRQLNTIQKVYQENISKKKAEPDPLVATTLQQSIPSAVENRNIEGTSNTESSNKVASKSALDNSFRESVNQKVKGTEPLKKIGKYPDISGIYDATTYAEFTHCGQYNQKIEYSAEEAIHSLKTDGKFKISYTAPLLKCSGKGKFDNDPNRFKGIYRCEYVTSGGFKGTLRMNIQGVIDENNIYMKYAGKDTSPGISCIYHWERTLSILQ